MTTVKVCYESSGNPAKDKRVAIGVDSLTAGGVTSGEWTDSNGEAHFDIKPCHGKVFVGGGNYDDYANT